MPEINQRVAMKAVIVNDEGKILVLRESGKYDEGTNVGKYDMPGGRVEPGENFEYALKREVFEETGLNVELKYPIYVSEWRPVIKGVQNQIVATFIVCEPEPNPKVKLSSDHDDYKWADPENYSDIDLMDVGGKVLDAYSARK